MSKTSPSPLDLLLPYQTAWVHDPSRFKIGLWARQTGKSFATAAEAVRSCMTHRTLWIALSAGERQALEWMRKAHDWARAFAVAVEGYEEVREHPKALLKSAEITWPNGSRLLALPANANTARGYAANLILDEFAFHEDPAAIWRAIYPSISNPLRGAYALRVVSTPNGKGNRFYELWQNNPGYSRHFVDVHRAKAAGLPLDLEVLRAGLDDPAGWAQEFECQFLDTATVLLPYALLATAEDANCPFELNLETLQGRDDHFVGMDIGRRHDLTVFWVLRRDRNGQLRTVGVKTMRETPFQEQAEALDAIMKQACVRHAIIDATGIGAMLAEEAQRRWGSSRITPMTFTAQTKNELFAALRAAFDQHRLTIPMEPIVREDLHTLQRVTTTSGQVTYRAARTSDGHADHATALALALSASKSTTSDLYAERVGAADISLFSEY